MEAWLEPVYDATGMRAADAWAISEQQVPSLELMERGAHFQLRETFESAIAFGRAALVGMGLPPERVAEVEEDIRQRDRERFAIQQQGRDVQAANDKLYTRPAPRPEPFIPPQRQAVSLNLAPTGEGGPAKDGKKE